MQTPINIYDKVADTISKGELDDAIDILKEHLRQQSKERRDLYQEATILDSKLAEWTKESRMGLAPSEAKYNRIRLSVLQLAEEAQQPVEPIITIDEETTATKPNYLIYSALTLTLILLGILVWQNIPSNTPTQELPKNPTTINEEVPVSPTDATTTITDEIPKSKNTLGTATGHASTATDMAIAQGKKQFFGGSVWDSNNDRWGRIEFSNSGNYAKWRKGTIKFYNMPQRLVLRGEVVDYGGKNTEFYMTAVNQNELRVAIGSPNAPPQVWKRK